MLELEVVGEKRQETLGHVLAELIDTPCILYLEGDLGAGKTTLARGLLRGLGYDGRVKSPTYTLLEPYELADVSCHHFDLYRLADPEELTFLGIEDLLHDDSIFLVEWPERGKGVLPPADCVLQIRYLGDRRQVSLIPASEKGVQLINNLQKVWQFD
ncbi:MAG: tRNA (adenosine(37)-N6)-threonylcarbamoyltransferase complex ATPase subunit type 1 TsaE [Candidatus Thiodiazotropha sp. (ex Notomyrtea botanica)]|nr:tRNA (adenosine(37)-N6)-threonylcarbamoyltransferase complex ATPase subunit type 1 TsaE [Candidatus Thiodiazotropha sp. (ex Notomyrtea botanica)]